MSHIIKTNKFGNFQYDGQNMPNEIELNPIGIWTIKDPTQSIIDYFPELEIREYNGVKFMFSEKASAVTPYPNQKYNGCACIIYTDTKVFLVADNKPYLQNVQGIKTKDETRPIDTIMREIKEELGLDMKYDRFVKIGYWSFNNVIELADYQCESITVVYGLRLLNYEVKQFLESPIVKVENDEIQFVANFDISDLANIPNKIEGKSFSGHHRQCLYDFFNINEKESIGYLCGYHIWGAQIKK